MGEKPTIARVLNVELINYNGIKFSSMVERDNAMQQYGKTFVGKTNF